MAQKVTSSKASTHTVGSVPASHHTWGKKSSDRSHPHTTHTATQVSSHPTTTPRKPSVQSTNTCTAGQGTARHSTASLGHNRHAAKQQQQCHPDTLHIQHRPAAAATHTCCFTAGRVPCRGAKKWWVCGAGAPPSPTPTDTNTAPHTLHAKPSHWYTNTRKAHARTSPGIKIAQQAGVVLHTPPPALYCAEPCSRPRRQNPGMQCPTCRDRV